MLYIRNMESDRCKLMVKKELNRLGLYYKTIELGEVELQENISKDKWNLIDIALRETGLELIDDKSNVLVDRIKSVVKQLINIPENMPKPNFSEYISSKVNRDYTYLSNLFSRLQGVTIEKYIISQKIELVKELLVYEELSLGDIAFKLQYSSVAHLSNQFKKVTGVTPSNFRELRKIRFQKSQNL